MIQGRAEEQSRLGRDSLCQQLLEFLVVVLLTELICNHDEVGNKVASAVDQDCWAHFLVKVNFTCLDANELCGRIACCQ